jgi:hypothetical protein
MEIVTKDMLDEFKKELIKELSEINNSISQQYPKKNNEKSRFNGISRLFVYYY